MKLQTLFATAILFASASTANAGSTVNTITEGWENGHTNIEVDNRRVERGDFNRYTENVKLDAVGERAQVNGGYYNGKFSFSGSASNIVNPDPFLNGGRSTNRETGSFTDVTKTNINSQIDFGNTSTEYKLDTAF